MNNKKVAIITLIFLLILPLSVSAGTFHTIVAFGNSLSDNGNLYEDTQYEIPDPAFYNQGRFSNGWVWVEYLANVDFLDCTLVDNAYGGANTSGDLPPGLVQQVSSYTSTPLPPMALFTIWAGGNDFILSGSTDFQTSANNIEIALNELASSGARDILILNLPDLGALPRFNGDPELSPAYTKITQDFNTALEDVIDDFISTNIQVNVYELDVYTLFQNIVADPEAYGFTNATDSSPNFQIPGEWGGDGYVFWDDLHPTTEAHEIVAEEVLKILPADSGDGGGGGCFINSVCSYKNSAVICRKLIRSYKIVIFYINNPHSV